MFISLHRVFSPTAAGTKMGRPLQECLLSSKSEVGTVRSPGLVLKDHCAGLAQLVERWLPKPKVARSCLVSRSISSLKIMCPWWNLADTPDLINLSAYRRTL